MEFRQTLLCNLAHSISKCTVDIHILKAGPFSHILKLRIVGERESAHAKLKPRRTLRYVQCGTQKNRPLSSLGQDGSLRSPIIINTAF